MEIYRKKNISNPLLKLQNHFVRKILQKNKDIFQKQNLPAQIGRINDYCSIRIATDGLYEIEQLDFIFDYLKQLDHNLDQQDVLDIGANTGNHSLYFSRIFKTVHAFEPNPKTFGILDVNTNECDNIKRYNFGLSNKNMTAEISEYSHNLGRSQVLMPDTEKTDGLIYRDIKLKKLDSLNDEILQSVALVKIDIEGHELNAIKGALEFINRTKPIILFEQLPEEFDEHNTTETIETLRQMGYKFIVIDKSFSNVPSTWLRFILKTIFRDEKYLRQTDTFAPVWYEMIIAIDSKVDLNLEKK